MCHVTLVNDDVEQVINESRPFNNFIAEKWALGDKNHLMFYSRLSSTARVTSLQSLPSRKSIYEILPSKLII